MDDSSNEVGSGRASWPWWFAVALAAGAALRVALALNTVGTDDVALWSHHVAQIKAHGLAESYARGPYFNHPPPSALFMYGSFEFAHWLGVNAVTPYRVLVACVGVLNVLLLVRVLAGQHWRWLAGAIYALSPMSLTLSGQHGNLDPLVATLALLGTMTAASGRVLATGVLIGLGAWLKLPALIAAPALGWAFQTFRQRALCAAVAVAVAAGPFVWGVAATDGMPTVQFDELTQRFSLEVDPQPANVFVRRVLLYRGSNLQLPEQSDAWLWGWRNLLVRAVGDLDALPGDALSWMSVSPALSLASILLVSYLRRSERTRVGIGANIGVSFVLFYALVNDCATQYFSWGAPFLFCLGPWIGCASHVVLSAFVYGFYALATADPLLRPPWSLERVGPWPDWLVNARDGANAWLLALGMAALSVSSIREVRAWRSERGESDSAA